MNENFSELPAGRAPLPVPAPHFPDALHAVVWRNWDVINVAALAEVLRGTPEQITEIASSMGLPPQREILSDELRRNYMTVIRRKPANILGPIERAVPRTAFTAMLRPNLRPWLARERPADRCRSTRCVSMWPRRSISTRRRASGQATSSARAIARSACCRECSGPSW